MNTCPICHKPVPGSVCENCGYDLSGDFVAFRTLSPVSEADKELLKTKRALAATKIKPVPPPPQKDERKAQKEAERKAGEEAERKRREEIKRKEKEEAERAAMEVIPGWQLQALMAKEQAEHKAAKENNSDEDAWKKSLWLLALIPVLALVLLFASGREEEPGPTVEPSAPPVTYSPTAAPTPTPHVHTWSPANCTRPAVCTLCGEEQGSALGHSWVAATYEQPRHCSVCGETDGEPLAPPTDAGNTIDYYTEDKSHTKRFGVRVAHTRKESTTNALVEDLRAAGYNPYVYVTPGKAGYGIVVGVYSKVADAKSLATYLHGQAPVSNADMDGAYAVNIYISSAAAEKYADYRR